MATLLFFIVFLYQTDFVMSNCTIPYCDSDLYDGTFCEQCKYGYYAHIGCQECGLVCRRYCGQNCFAWLHGSCPNEICGYEDCSSSICNTYNNVVCEKCPDGFYIDYHRNNRCYRCTHPNCKCSTANDCTECLPGKYGTSNLCQGDCPRECNTCFSTFECTECVAGKYGISCKFDCKSYCDDGTCHKHVGTCSRNCSINEYSASGSCKACPEKCRSCFNSTHCIECSAGSYGLSCENNCTSVCIDYTCDKESGNCLSSCALNEYFESGICNHCPNRCLSCINRDYCTHCTRSYTWGASCEFDCTGCVTKCNRSIGCSLGCDSCYYQSYSVIMKGYQCIMCPLTCLACKNESFCTLCKEGYWGNTCQYSCIGCSSNGCYKAQGCDECLPSYYRHVTYDGTECLKCPVACKICSAATYCNECKNGFFPSEELNCVLCPNYCKRRNCNPHNGSCIDGCIDGRMGHRCEDFCPLHCVKCNQFSASLCLFCEPGFYGSACQYDSKNCIPQGTNKKCDKNNGSCLHGCVDGYWGSHCSKSCEEGCANGICNGKTGQCLVGCKATHYGQNCESKCTPTCKFTTGERRCDITNGSCPIGCVNGFSGDDYSEMEGLEAASTPSYSYERSTIGLSVVVGVLITSLAISIVLIMVLFKKLRNTHTQRPEENTPYTTQAPKEAPEETTDVEKQVYYVTDGSKQTNKTTEEETMTEEESSKTDAKEIKTTGERRKTNKESRKKTEAKTA